MYHWPHRKNLRLKNFNYSENWYYFVTICTKNRENFFGNIKNGEMILNEIGEITKEEILKTQEMRKEIFIDIFVIMPNHLHILIEIFDENNIFCKEWMHSFLTGLKNVKWNNVSAIIRGIKSSITTKIRQNFPNSAFGWQKSFYDVIIKNENQLIKTREYIFQNPVKWDEDKNNPKNF